MFENIWKMGADFRRFRKRECRVSVHELSKRTGICATQIYKFERGQSDIKLKTFARLVHALNYDFQLTYRNDS